MIIILTLVLISLKGRCYSNQLIRGLFANVEIDHLQSWLWRSETECNIAICIKALTPAIMQLCPVKNLVNFGAVTREITFLICVYLCVVTGRTSI